MDRFLDTVFGLFGIDSKAEREAQRQARLRQAATAAPVTAQRPVAPLRLSKGKDDSEVNMTSMSDSGGVETVISTSGQLRDGFQEPDSGKIVPTVSESLERKTKTTEKHRFLLFCCLTLCTAPKRSQNILFSPCLYFFPIY